MIKQEPFNGPAVGYGRNELGEHMVFLYADNCFINTQTARDLATDLLIWAERIDKQIKEEQGGDENTNT